MHPALARGGSVRIARGAQSRSPGLPVGYSCGMAPSLPTPPPPSRWREALQFRIERFLLRGAHYRLGFIALLIGLVAVGGGLAVHWLAPGDLGGADAVWWAFLRLTDPGYLGDDEGVLRRLIATLITICGYVLFMGALIAIMTQWLEATVRRLERGETPIAMQGHVVILGTAHRVAPLIEELLFSETRLRRFLRQRRVGGLRLVVMTDEVDAAFRSDLRTRLGPIWDEQRLILRSGSRVRLEHLERVDFSRAAALLLPAGDEADASERDAATIKALLTIIRHPLLHDVDLPPRLVAEVKDHRVLEIVRQSYRGQLDLVPGDLVVGRFLAHTIRHPGLSYVLRELLVNQSGNNLVFRSLPGLEGLRFLEAASRFTDAVLLGVVRPGPHRSVPILNPPADLRIEPGDVCVLVAESFELEEPEATSGDPGLVQQGRRSVRAGLARQRRLLLLGWNTRVHDLLVELETYEEESYSVDAVSTRTVEERQSELAEAGYEPGRVALRHIHADSSLTEVHRRLDAAAYDVVVFVARGRTNSGEASDARTLLGYLALRAVHPTDRELPPIIVELLDEDDIHLFERRAGEVVLSSALLSHVLAQVALRPELGVVVEELFTVEGAELHFREAEELGALGRPIRFRELQERAWAQGELALGVRLSAGLREPDGGMVLNPGPDAMWTLGAEDAVLVLSTY